MTLTEIRAHCSIEVSACLERFGVVRDAFTPNALVDAGVPVALVNLLIADGRNAVPERPRVSITGRGRAEEETRRYVWGPDVAAFLVGIR